MSDNVVKLNTPFQISADLKILKADCIAFTKRLGAYSAELEKLSARFAAQDTLQKAEKKQARRKLRAAQVDALASDLSKFDRGMTKRNRPLGK
jgi:hypothetical protein